MKELENLLTSLIQRGRKPWGLGYFAEVMVFKTYIDFITKKGASSPTSLRELVSLESGLWQFVCNNKLYKETNKSWESGGVSVNSVNVVEFCSCSLPQFRLLESALLPEEELAQFLLSNIVIEGNSSPEAK